MMTKIAKLSDKENQWVYFFTQLVKEYIQSDKFLSMLGTMPNRMSDLVEVIKKAYKQTILHFEDEHIIPTAWWKLCNELKCKVITSHKHSLNLVGDAVIEAIKEYLPKRKKTNIQLSKLWDNAELTLNETSTSVFTTVEQIKYKSKIIDVERDIKTNSSILGFFNSDLRAIDLAIKLSFQLSSYLADSNHRDLVLAYKKYLFDSNIQKVAEKNYQRFKEHCSEIKKDEKTFTRTTKKIRELISIVDKHLFRGISFPTYPGMISSKSCLRFPNIHQSSHSPIFSFRVHGEGWDKEKVILPVLVKLNEELQRESKNQSHQLLEKLSDSLKRYLQIIAVEISSNDLLTLYERLDEIVNSEWVPEHSHRIEEDYKISSNKLKISPKSIRANTLVVFLHENIASMKVTKNNQNESNYWNGKNTTGIQEFIAYLMANTEFLPKKVKIYHRSFKCDIQSSAKNHIRFFMILKSVIDSAIIFLLMINDPEIKGSMRKLEHEFQHISGGTNIWFLPFTMVEGAYNTLFHDYYYMLLKGVTAWEAKYFERKNNIQPVSPVDDTSIFDFDNMISFSWKKRSQLSLLRRKLNVQVMNLPSLRKWGKFNHSIEQLNKEFGSPANFYRFKNAGNMFCYFLTSKEGTRCIALPSLYLQRFMSHREKRTPQVTGMLSTDRWYFASHSLKNTSTAGYELLDFKTSETMKITDVLLLSIDVETWYNDKENNETSYLRHCSLHAHLSTQREIQILDEYFIDNYVGNVNEESHFHTASKIIAELSKFEIPIVVRIKHSRKTEDTYQIIDYAVQNELLDEDNTNYEMLDYDTKTLKWLINENKKRLLPLFIYTEKAIVTPPYSIKEKRSFQQITYFIEHPVFPKLKVEQKLIGMLIYGSRKDVSIKEGKPIKKDLFPSLIFTIIPKNYDTEVVKKYLEQLNDILPCYADEKGGSSVASLKRLFNLPNPDPSKISNPSIFIKGINRLDFPQDVI